MKSNGSNIHHFTGTKAYFIYWIAVYDCFVSISTIMAIDMNLEIIVNDDGDLLAYRYDYPETMAGMVKNEGQWQIHNPKLDSNKNWLISALNETETLNSFVDLILIQPKLCYN